jgi:outer membrane protein OmpA-like peptidoglycan-associated protein
MKCRVVQAVMITVLAGVFLPGLAQKNYYVVVGAFSTEGNAKDFTTYLPSLNADTAYSMNGNEQVVHLYVLRTTSEELAIAKSQQLQNSLEQSNGKIVGNYQSVFVSNLPEAKRVTVTKATAPNPSVELPSEPASSKASTPSGPSLGAASNKAATKLFKFTISDPNGQVMPGKVHYIDYKKERDLASYSAFVYTSILNPGENEDVAAVCGIFGYKQSEKSINYEEPALIEGAFQDENGAWVIPYKLVRLEKGDVSVMYNVAFHKDAVIMLPQSRVDLQELVTMMKENPWYEITIHGHCNGKNDRKIIAMGESQEYFDPKGSRHFYGSAKELTALRADAIREYLVKNGIQEDRIRTYAWGGRYMLVDPTSAVSKLNDRIEIEIRKD